jgi:hypothetical protein
VLFPDWRQSFLAYITAIPVQIHDDDEVVKAEVFIPTKCKKNDQRMVAARTLVPLPLQQPHLLSLPQAQADDLLAAKRPRLEILTYIAENVATTSQTIDTVTNASHNDGWVVVASSSSATPPVDSFSHPRKEKSVEEDEKPTGSTKRVGKWSTEEDETLIEALKKHGSHWVAIAQLIQGRDAAQCRFRWSKSLARKVEQKEVNEKPTETRKTGTWNADEDEELMKAVRKYGTDWIAIASMIPGRTNVQCRCRNTWVMRFDPSLSGQTAHAGKRAAEEDARTPIAAEGEAAAIPIDTTISSASSTDTEALSYTDSAKVTAQLISMEGSRVAPPQPAARR